MAETFSIQAIFFVGILLVYVLASHFIQIRKIPYLHESTIAIIMGGLSATFAKIAFGESFQFSGDIFFTIILPPIIFSAGYSLRKSLFFQNFGIISFLGVIGTILGFVLISCFMGLLNVYIFKTLTLSEVLLVSSVLCATDTVAAMSLIKPQKYPVLNAVLFGQGIINDAVAIILFRTVAGLNLQAGSSFTFGTFLDMIFSFCYLFFFSIILGLFFGFGISYLFKINQSFLKYPIKQTSLILLNGYITYLIGDVSGLSGIISLFTCAIIMGHYSFMNISHQAKTGTGLAFETVSYIAQAFVYAYLGASILSINSQWLAVGMSVLILAFLPLARAAMIYFLPAIYYLMKKVFPLNNKQLKICWYSGIVRGVIAFALCLQITGENQDFVRTIALIVVMVTTIIGSSFLKSFAKWIGMDDEQVSEDPINYQRMIDQRINNNSMTNYYNVGLGYQSEPSVDPDQKMSTTRKMEQFQNKFIKPLFEKKKNLTYELQGVDNSNQL